MTTCFNAAAQLVLIAFALFTFDRASQRGVHAFRRHSTRRPGTETVLALMARLGTDALQRYASKAHTKHSSGIYTVGTALA